MSKVLIRTDASNSTGMGHLNRCVSLARHFEIEGIESLLILRHASDNIVTGFKNQGLNISVLEKCGSLYDEALLISNRFASQYSAIVFDFSHYQIMSRVEELIPYFKILHNSFSATLLIDGLDDTAIIDHIEPSIDVVVTPYIGAKCRSADENPGFRHWAGPAYFIFPPEFTSINWDRQVRGKAKNLLVSMGGSDPYELTLMIIDALQLLESEIICRVVVGPGFTESLKLKIEKACAVIPCCKIVFGLPTLIRHLQWADIAISASGLTKYEMAYAGVPSLQLSFNAKIAAANAQDETKGFYLDLGLYTETTSLDIANEIDALVRSFERRREMVRLGQALFSKTGLDSLIREVRGNIVDSINCN
ncbi:MAG: hypothetical protein SWH54_18750 [Thermodesulfobacteriota bacterium]|nr:hypothetical protein [Thermodesulfobacteriota bacterium]